MSLFIVNTETEEDSFPLLLITVIPTVVMALLAILMAVILGIAYYKKRKQQRTSAKQDIEIPEYAEISPDCNETSHTESLEQTTSGLTPIKTQKNVVYGVGSHLGRAQNHEGDDGEYEVIQPQSPLFPETAASHVMMFAQNVAYGVTGKRV